VLGDEIDRTEVRALGLALRWPGRADGHRVPSWMPPSFLDGLRADGPIEDPRADLRSLAITEEGGIAADGVLGEFPETRDGGTEREGRRRARIHAKRRVRAAAGERPRGEAA
jgi:hypothetical protein